MIGKEGGESIPNTFMSKFPKVTSVFTPLYKLRLRLQEVTGLSDSGMFHIPPRQHCKFWKLEDKLLNPLPLMDDKVVTKDVPETQRRCHHFKISNSALHILTIY